MTHGATPGAAGEKGMFCSPETLACGVLCSQWGNRGDQGSHCLLTADSPLLLRPVWSLVYSFFSPQRAVFLLLSWATPVEVHKRCLICSWMLHLLSQAPCLESGLLYLSLFSITWWCPHLLLEQLPPSASPVQIPGIRITNIPSADRSLAGCPRLLRVLHLECPTPVLHMLAGILFLLGHLLSFLQSRPPWQRAQNWNSLQTQLLVPSPSLAFEPRDRDASKSCCLLSFYPSVSIVRPGWIPQSDTGDSHAWIKGYGTCCSVDPCHKKNGQNLNEQRNFRATCKSSLSEMFQTKKKKKKTTSCIVSLFPNFTSGTWL